MTKDLDDGDIGVPYSQKMTAVGGTAPYTWSIAAGKGTLPTGLTLSSTGTISGTPTKPGTSTFTVVATDMNGKTTTRALSITVETPITITPPTLPAGIPSVAYKQQLTVSGGIGPFHWYTYSYLPGEGLPSGFGISVTGTVSGTPTTVGKYTFGVSVEGGTNTVASRTYTLTIGPPQCSGTVCAVADPEGTVTVEWTTCDCGIYPDGTSQYFLQDFISGVWGGTRGPWYEALYLTDLVNTRTGDRVWSTYPPDQLTTVVGQPVYIVVNYTTATLKAESTPTTPVTSIVTIGTSNTIVTK